MPNIKATPVNGLVRFTRERLAAEQYRRLLSSFDETEQSYFTGSLLTHEQVPLELVNRWTELASNLSDEELKQFAYEAGRYSASLSVGSVLSRMLLSVATIETALRKAAFTFSSVYDTGELSVEARENSARLELRDFPSHVASCARITGWTSYIAEAAGARNSTAEHTECRAEGDELCVWELSWD